MHHLTMVPLVMESPIDGTFMVSWARMGYVVDTAQRWKVISVIIVVVVIGRADAVVLNLIVVWMSSCRLEGLMALDGSMSS